MTTSISGFRMGEGGGDSVMGVFRQLVAQGGIKFNFGVVQLELKEEDLQRIHDIIHEIDDRRAFYNAFDDEIPAHMVESVRSAKRAIHELRKGVWANSWAREVVQILLHNIGEFLTQVERQPLPSMYSAPEFRDFEQAAVELRLKIWTAVAHLVVVFGDSVRPFHLPPEILEEVAAVYKKREKK